MSKKKPKPTRPVRKKTGLAKTKKTVDAAVKPIVCAWQYYDLLAEEWIEVDTETAAEMADRLSDGDDGGRQVRLGDGSPEVIEAVPAEPGAAGDIGGGVEIKVGETRPAGEMLAQMVDQARREEIEREARRHAMAAEIAKYRWYLASEKIHRLEDGRTPLNFQSHPFLPEIYKDTSLDGILYGSAQFGKPQPIWAKVLTPYGWRRMGALRAGDQVCVPDGGTARIGQVFEKGRKPIYRISTKDGGATHACADHEWKISDRPNGELRKISTQAIDELLSAGKEVWLPPGLDGEAVIEPRRIVDVHSAGEADCRCIFVDHPDHLYFADDHIITKNTEWMICDIAASAALGLKVLVVISKYDKRDKFAAGRLDPCFSVVPFYKKMIDIAKARGGKSDSTRLKHFGDGSINLVAATADRDFTSYAADKVDTDEYQECKQDNLKMIDDRLSGSPFRLMWRLGHPTIDGTEENGNLDYLYKNSDQRIWKIPCLTCGEFQVMNWWDHIVGETRNKHGGIVSLKPRDQEWQPGSKLDMRAICTFCHRPMNRLCREGSLWEIRNPGHERHGYKLSNIYNPNKRLSELFERYSSCRHSASAMGEFVNKQLGETWSQDGSKVTEGMLGTAAKCEFNGITKYRFVPVSHMDWRKIAEEAA
jgi:hypothetical protein